MSAELNGPYGTMWTRYNFRVNVMNMVKPVMPCLVYGNWI